MPPEPKNIADNLDRKGHVMQNAYEVPQWYALQVRPQHEDMVSALLRYKGYEEYLPSYQVANQTKRTSNVPAKKLFPGYVFCRFNYDKAGQVSNGLGVVTTPGVIRVLGGRKPIPVPPQEIISIQCALSSRIIPKPWPFLRTGLKVEMEAGPFRGISGIVVCTKGTYRLVLSVDAMQRSVAVTVEKEWLSPTVIIREALDTARASLG